MRSDRELEEMIDTAIPGYSAVEPPPGLEQSILARSLAPSHDDGRRRSRRFAWQWSLAIPAIACLLILFFLPRRRNPSLPMPETAAKAAPATSAPAVGASPTRRATQPRPRPAQVARTPQPLPKQDVFPSPTPLTPEEEAMVALTRAQARIGSQPSDAKTEIEIPEVHIAELEIKPLPTLPEQNLGPSAVLPSLTSQRP